MKILHIEDMFFPDAGYQLNLLAKYQKQQGHQVIIITAVLDEIKGCVNSFFGTEGLEDRDAQYRQTADVPIIRVKPRWKRLLSGRVIFNYKRLMQIVQQVEPDVVFVHGNDTFTGIQFTIHQKKKRIPLVLDSHMLDMASKNPFQKLFKWFYRHWITPILVKQKIPVIRTQDDDYVQKRLGIPLSQCPWISVGSDTMLFHPDEQVRAQFRQENGIAENDFVVVYTGKLDESKGGKLLAKAFLEPFETEKNVVLLVVGNTSGEYGQEVEELFQQSKNRIIRFPTQKYMDLAPFYQAADLSVFPKQCSLSFYDAQACGLPVVSEDNNINVERCSHENGLNFKAGDVEDFRKQMLEVIQLTEEEYSRMSKNAFEFVAKNYDYARISEEYTKILEQEVNRWKKK